jgi:hypothetical protein
VQFVTTRPENLVFLDDLPRILDDVGRTDVTMAHTDRPTVRAYNERMCKETAAKRPERDWDEAERTTRLLREKMRAGVPQPQSKPSKLQAQAQQTIAYTTP